MKTQSKSSRALKLAHEIFHFSKINHSPDYVERHASDMWSDALKESWKIVNYCDNNPGIHKECRFQIGDKVSCKKGAFYSAYEFIAKVLGLKNWVCDRFPESYKNLTVIGGVKHQNTNVIVVAVRDENGNEFLFEESGIELV